MPGIRFQRTGSGSIFQNVVSRNWFQKGVSQTVSSEVDAITVALRCCNVTADVNGPPSMMMLVYFHYPENRLINVFCLTINYYGDDMSQFLTMPGNRRPLKARALALLTSVRVWGGLSVLVSLISLALPWWGIETIPYAS